ncbi:Inorganic phosphate transporter pho84 [Rhizophlyctis rosea]|nr:Inorganic phosphate transporter pho84 [Rhizophlyctis rosea]
MKRTAALIQATKSGSGLGTLWPRLQAAMGDEQGGGFDQIHIRNVKIEQSQLALLYFLIAARFKLTVDQTLQFLRKLCGVGGGLDGTALHLGASRSVGTVPDTRSGVSCWVSVSLPALIAIYFRLIIPETPRYTVDVIGPRDEREEPLPSLSGGSLRLTVSSLLPPLLSPRTFPPSGNTLVNGSTARSFFATAYCWFALDIAWYGLSLNEGTVLSLINNGGARYTDQFNINYQKVIRNLIIACAGTVPGYYVCVALIERVCCKPFQLLGFAVITIILCVLAGIIKNRLGACALSDAKIPALQEVGNRVEPLLTDTCMISVLILANKLLTPGSALGNSVKRLDSFADAQTGGGEEMLDGQPLDLATASGVRVGNVLKYAMGSGGRADLMRVDPAEFQREIIRSLLFAGANPNDDELAVVRMAANDKTTYTVTYKPNGNCTAASGNPDDYLSLYMIADSGVRTAEDGGWDSGPGWKNMQTWLRFLPRRKLTQPAPVCSRCVPQYLTGIDFVFVEEAFEWVFLSMDVRAALWGGLEVHEANREFGALAGLPMEDLGCGVFMSEESAVYWEKYGSIAFDADQRAVLTSCVLKYSGEGVEEGDAWGFGKTYGRWGAGS